MTVALADRFYDILRIVPLAQWNVLARYQQYGERRKPATSLFFFIPVALSLLTAMSAHLSTERVYFQVSPETISLPGQLSYHVIAPQRLRGRIRSYEYNPTE